MVMGKDRGREGDASVAFAGDDGQLLETKERMPTGRERKRHMYACICIYISIYIVQETLTLALLCFETFPN